MSSFVAGQRVISRYGTRPPAAQIRKAASVVTDFEVAVDKAMIEKKLSRTAAMTDVRKRQPDLFRQFQEA